MRNAKQKEKAEITNEAERRGKILPRRQAAKGRGLIDMEFDFISGAFVFDSEQQDEKKTCRKQIQKEGKITVRFHL